MYEYMNEYGVIVKVAVEAGYGDGDRLYDYALPDGVDSADIVGRRVSVPFGRSKYNPREVKGVVFEVVGSPDIMNFYYVREITEVLPDYAPLSAELLQLAKWLRDYTFCTYYGAVRAIQPNVSNKPAMCEILSFDPNGRVMVNSPRRRTVIEWLAANPNERLTAIEVAAKCGVSVPIVKKLVKDGVVAVEVEYKTKNAYAKKRVCHKEIILSKHQQDVYHKLCELYEQPVAKCALLRGVTGSGKTAVFIKLIEKALSLGQTAIMLVPEISLTPQAVTKFSEIFGEKVAILHSGLSDGERAGEYARARSGDARIVIGTRSAVFAPLENIGIVIVDEESEHSYKSESQPRYHARDAAKQRCFYHNALLLLASATPSVESYYFAKSGRYSLCELHERFNVSPLPAVSLVDMRSELPQTVLSRPLVSALCDTLRRGEQALILLNRRGYSTRVACTKCGWGYYCPNCALPLTFHAHGDAFKCHYCGYLRYPPRACPECGGDFLKRTGSGTQKVEEALAQLLPNARLLRMDRDTAVTKNVYERSFAAYAAGEYDIMLGTQMIAKGLDFPNVTLVGVLSIDNALCAGDYQAYERVFSLITQVVGRCGRGR